MQDLFKNTRKVFFVTLATAIVCLITSWLVLYVTGNSSNKNSSSSHQNRSFPTYYPSKLPASFTLNSSSIEKKANLTAYTIRYEDEKTLFVSVQPRPSKAVLDKFNNDQIVFAEPTETSLEEAFIGNVRGNVTASLVAERSWILITAPQGIETNQLKEIVKSFTSPAE